MANEKRPCIQLCSWNDPSDGCIIPAHETCPMSNTAPDCSGWGNVRVNEKRLIDANKAQAVLVNMAEHLQEAGNPEMAGAVGYAAELIGKQKTVDAVEVVHGEWIYHECVSSHDGTISGYSCSKCCAFVNEEIFDMDEFNKDFCGRCGAKMDGGNEDGKPTGTI